MAVVGAYTRTYYLKNLFMNTLKKIYKQMRELYEYRHEPESVRPLAEIYWRLLLFVAVVCVAMILAYGVSEFIGVISKLNSGSSKNSNPPVVLNRNQLNSTLSGFDARRARVGITSGGGAVLDDPSK